MPQDQDNDNGAGVVRQAPTPGPLSGDDVKLLVKGDLCLTPDGPKAFDHSTHWDHVSILWFSDGDSAVLYACAFIGRPDESGWMPWSGGENPVPGQKVHWQTRNEPNRSDCEIVVPSEALDWAWPPRQSGNPPIIAFRLAPTAPVEASGSERDGYVTAFYDIAKMLGIGARAWSPAETWRREMRPKLEAALRPQPSGETREAVARIIADHVAGGFDAALQDEQEWKDRSGLGYDCEPSDVNGPFKDDYLDAADAILALLSARPLALGGQQGEPVAYRQWCQSDKPHQGGWWQLIEKHDGDHAIANGGGKNLRPLYDTTPARAEAQDEGAAGEPVAWRFRDHPSNGWIYTGLGGRHDGCEVQPLYAHPSPTPAVDADRGMKAFNFINDLYRIKAEFPAIRLHGALKKAEALAALKSEGK